jgi:hypothetical protein
VTFCVSTCTKKMSYTTQKRIDRRKNASTWFFVTLYMLLVTSYHFFLCLYMSTFFFDAQYMWNGGSTTDDRRYIRSKVLYIIVTHTTETKTNKHEVISGINYTVRNNYGYIIQQHEVACETVPYCTNDSAHAFEMCLSSPRSEENTQSLIHIIPASQHQHRYAHSSMPYK